MAIIDIINYIKSVKILYVLILCVLFYLGSRLFSWIAEKTIHALVKKTKTEIDDKIIKGIHVPVTWLLSFITVRIFILPLLDIQILNRINDSIIIAFITFSVIRIADVFIEEWGIKWAAKTKSTIDDALIPLFHKFSRIAFAIIGFILILHVWHVNITPFLASLGVAGIVLAFALQSTLGNIFGGISMILDKNVSVGDTIKLSSGESGVVEDVGIRSTKVRSFDNEIYIIPNGKLADSIIQNYAQPDISERIVIDFGVAYGTNPEKVRKIIVDVMKKHKEVMKKPEPKVVIVEMGDFALKLQAIFWVDSYKKRFDVKTDLVENIYNALNKNKIEIPFPTQTVYVKNKK
ncbi:MAG: mechanosensitive ion channel family protein [archaeon]